MTAPLETASPNPPLPLAGEGGGGGMLDAARPDPSTELAWYIYAIQESGAPATPREAGSILPNTEVATIPIGAFNVLATLVPRALFDQQSPSHKTNDPIWMAGCAYEHHSVTCAAAAAGPCLPLCFATLFSSLDLIAQWLQPRTAHLLAALAQLHGQAEWVLTLTEDPAQHECWLNRHDATLQALQLAAENASTGTAFLLTKRIDKARANARAAHLHQLEAQITQMLAPHPGPIFPERAAHGLPRWAILAPTHESAPPWLTPLEQRLATTGLAATLQGPWPAYAFARATLQQMEAAHV